MNKNSVNKVILVGHLGKDPEVRYTPSGTAVGDMTIATSESFKGKDGNYQDKTEWHNLVVWGQQAEFAKEYIKKGQMVYIEGSLQTRSWDDQNSGQKRYKTEVKVNTLTVLGGLGGRSKNTGGSQTSNPAPVEEDDIPF